MSTKPIPIPERNHFFETIHSPKYKTTFLDTMMNSLEKLKQHQDNKCSICLGNNESFYKLPNCGHIYHKNCIKRWYIFGNKSCPNCRNNFFETMICSTH